METKNETYLDPSGIEFNISNMDMPAPEDMVSESSEIALEAEKIQAFANSIGSLADVMTKFTEAAEAIQAFAKAFAAIDIKRIHLGSTYAYNILSRFKFLVKSPKIVSVISGIIIWVFMRLPRWLILRWRSPELRD